MKIGYLGRRLASAAITIVLIAVINFMLFRAMPGSPERIILRGTPNVDPGDAPGRPRAVGPGQAGLP